MERAGTCMVSSMGLEWFEWNFKYGIIKLILMIHGWGISLWNCLQINITGPHWWLINTGSGNGLVPGGTKPLPEPEPMLTQLDVSPYGVTRPQWVTATSTIPMTWNLVYIQHDSNGPPYSLNITEKVHLQLSWNTEISYYDGNVLS